MASSVLSATLEQCRTVEWLSEDTLICNNVIKRVWPASQRDALFWSHIRNIQGENEDSPDSWIVVNYSCDHPNCGVSPSSVCHGVSKPDLQAFWVIVHDLIAFYVINIWVQFVSPTYFVNSWFLFIDVRVRWSWVYHCIQDYCNI